MQRAQKTVYCASFVCKLNVWWRDPYSTKETQWRRGQQANWRIFPSCPRVTLRRWNRAVYANPGLHRPQRYRWFPLWTVKSVPRLRSSSLKTGVVGSSVEEEAESRGSPFSINGTRGHIHPQLQVAPQRGIESKTSILQVPGHKPFFIWHGSMHNYIEQIAYIITWFHRAYRETDENRSSIFEFLFQGHLSLSRNEIPPGSKTPSKVAGSVTWRKDTSRIGAHVGQYQDTKFVISSLSLLQINRSIGRAEPIFQDPLIAPRLKGIFQEWPEDGMTSGCNIDKTRDWNPLDTGCILQLAE
jgi:hypothetical protein